MELTQGERQALDGARGEAIRLAMRILVALGEWADASRLIPVSSSQVAGVSYRTGGEGLVTFLRDMVRGGARVTIPTFLNPSGMDYERWNEMGVSPEFASVQQDIIGMYESMGIYSTCTCAGYDIGNITRLGEHVAWSESSMVAFGNSYFGARTNREGGPSALASAIIGKTPEYGLHLDVNRIPSVKVVMDTPMKGPTDLGIMGLWYANNFTDGEIPVFQGIDKALAGMPFAHHMYIKQLCAALGSGNIPMFHAYGVTPEQGLIPEHLDTVVRFDAAAREETLEKFIPTGDRVDIAVFGCPHSSMPEIEEIASLLDGRRLRPDADLWVFTGRHNTSLLEASGLKKRIESSGARVFYDTCPVVAPIKGMFPRIATNSAKAAHYLPTMAMAEVLLSSTAECIESVIDGGDA